MNVTELTEPQWTEILSHMPSNSIESTSHGGLLPPLLDRWLKDLCAPFIKRIEQRNAPLWSKCHKIPLDQHELSHALQELEILQEPGAVLLVAGDDGLSHLIRSATQSRFSHVGMIFPAPIPSSTDGPMLWQSYAQTPTKANYPYDPSFLPGQMTHWGVDVSDLARYMLDYVQKEPGVRFVIRRLSQPLNQDERHLLHHTIDQFLDHQITYPNPVRLALLFLRDRYPSLRFLCDALLGPGPIDTGGEFCSMVVAHTLLDTDVLDTIGRGTESYLPGDYSLDLDHVSTQPLRKYTTPLSPMYEPNEVELQLVLTPHHRWGGTWCLLQ